MTCLSYPCLSCSGPIRQSGPTWACLRLTPRQETGRRELQRLAVERLTTSRYSITHALMATLPHSATVTTNSDKCYDAACAAAGIRLVPLPYESRASGRTANDRCFNPPTSSYLFRLAAMMTHDCAGSIGAPTPHPCPCLSVGGCSNFTATSTTLRTSFSPTRPPRPTGRHARALCKSVCTERTLADACALPSHAHAHFYM